MAVWYVWAVGSESTSQSQNIPDDGGVVEEGQVTKLIFKDSMNIILEIICLSEALQGSTYMNPPPRTILDKSHLRHHSEKIKMRTRCHHTLSEALVLCKLTTMDPTLRKEVVCD